MTVEQLLSSIDDQISAKVIAIEEGERQLGRAFYEGYGWTNGVGRAAAYEKLKESHEQHDVLCNLAYNLRVEIARLERLSQPLGPVILTVDEIAAVNTEDIPF